MEMETTTTPHDERIYMHTAAEMESIIETVIMMEMGHEILKNDKCTEKMKLFVNNAIDVMFQSLIEKLASEDAERAFEKIQKKCKDVDLLKTLEELD